MGLIRRGKIWHYDFIFDGQRYFKTTKQTSKMLAREVEAKRFRELREGILDHPIEDITFQELTKKYRRLHGRGRSFHEAMCRVLERHFGERLISELTPLDIDTFLGERALAVGPSSYNQSLTVLKQMLRLAVKWHHLRASPAEEAKRLKVPKGRERFLSEEEAGRLLAATPGWLAPLLLTAIHTGARQGELLGLEWGTVDLARGFLVFVKTKNGEIRTVKMSRTVAGILEALPSKEKGGRVFRNRSGNRIHRDGLTWSFRRACQRANVVGLRFHDLRHSAASFMVQAGEPLNTVREILGHKDLKMTLRYAHLAPGHQKNAMDAMDALSFSRVPAKVTALPLKTKTPRRSRGAVAVGSN